MSSEPVNQRPQAWASSNLSQRIPFELLTFRSIARREDPDKIDVLTLDPLTLTLSPEDGGEGTRIAFNCLCYPLSTIHYPLGFTS